MALKRGRVKGSNVPHSLLPTPHFHGILYKGMGGKQLTKPKDKTTPKIKEPQDYRVILLNDHYTTMDFVVDVLMTIFHKTIEDANKIMLDVHKKGKGIVGQYSLDIAATKAEQVHVAARENEFPLRCIVEPV
jgi:ATP-dependent Clp protease adaptor protein ClpS